MTWRAARSLLILQLQLMAGAPRARPPATEANAWGLIGDAAHDPSSDHSPKNFPGWGLQIVTATDFPNRPDLGLDARRVLEDIRKSRDSRVKYGISNGEIFSSHKVTENGRTYLSWQWRPYNPKNGDRHFTHGHLSVVGDARADGEQPWATIGAPAGAAGSTEDEDDMGASFGPIEINASGGTSLTIPPVEAGIADQRRNWINFCNDTNGADYSLRVWTTNGAGGYAPLPGWGDKGEKTLKSGVRESVQLPKGTAGLAISRTADAPYTGHLTLAIERGPVIPA